MLRITNITRMLTLGLVLLFALPAYAQDEVRRQDNDRERDDRQYEDYNYEARVDRFLDAEVWTNHADGEYFENDKIRINYRVSRDAFVVIYSIDTRGRVNLLFPTEPGQDNFVYGGVTNTLPGPQDEYDLVVSGPEGLEHIQIIASRDRFPIPPWYNNSGLVFDGDDRYDYMDFLNSKYFVRYSGQRFAYDRAVIFVDEWEPNYYHPVYYPTYPSWTVAGNVYIDYPYGSSIYINGYYWGIAPLYVPRIAVGWHTISVFDHYGHCWESDFHVSHYNTTVFDRTVIKTSASTRSRYASVRKSGYLDPVKNGYPNYKVSSKKIVTTQPNFKNNVKSTRSVTNKTVTSKKFVRGSGKVVKTSRGYESNSVTGSSTYKSTRKTKNSTGTSYYTGKKKSSSNYNSSKADRSSKKSSSSSGSSYYQKKSSSKSNRSMGSTKSSTQKSGSKQTYQPKSGSNKSSKSTKGSSSKINKSGSSKKSSGKVSTKSSGSKSKSSVSKKSTPSKKSSGSNKSSSSYKSTGSKKSSGSSSSVKSGSSRPSGSTSKSSGRSKSSGSKRR